MGVFANHPDVLQLQDHDTVDVPGLDFSFKIISEDGEYKLCYFQYF